ncbi:hypothetical protein D4764_0280510 [Takifugu flavidus]|uniref:Uncharacterized protein n=1 Tax=Takifugu flavidus TaxID=433684 RepID=A0A5C6MHN9_9TELE|nr:hypothetical protein D4764_0280510 [Takifugu flavidus]
MPHTPQVIRIHRGFGTLPSEEPYFGLDQQVPRVAGKEYVVTRGTTEDTWTGFVSRNSLRACLLKDLEYPLVERARNSVLVASMKSPWCLLQGCGLLMAKVRHHPAGPEFMVKILFVRCDQRLDFWGQCVHGRSPSGSGSERWGLRITIHSAILKMGCQFKSPVVLLQVPSSLLQEILVGPLCWDKWRRLEKLTSGTQIPALGKRSSAVSTAALIWADKVTILLIPLFPCQLTPFERIWVEQCHWPSVKQVDLQQEEEGRRERMTAAQDQFPSPTSHSGNDVCLCLLQSLPMEPFAQVPFCPNGGNLERSLPSLE